MIAALERFVVALRREGIAVSPAEWLDALRAVVEVSLDDRERVRLALRASLVKHRGQRDAFDAAFDRFFASPARGRGRLRPSAGEPGSGRAARSPAGERVPRASPLGRRLEELTLGNRTRLGRLRHVITTPPRERPGDWPAQPRAGSSPPAAKRDRARRLELGTEAELAAEVPRIVRRIRLSAGRRRRDSTRGQLYLRRLFRESLRHGGVPFVLPRRRARPRRARVVLLIDVSWSVAPAAGLFLAIAGELIARSSRARVIFFVDRIRDVTPDVECWLGRRGSLSQPLGGLELEAPSDYGRSFHQLLRSPERPAGRNTVLLVLGDGRTNRLDPQAWAFEELAERCGAVIWLVPEELARWGTGDSALGDYLPHVDVAVEAHDLAGLARGVAELVRRIAR